VVPFLLDEEKMAEFLNLSSIALTKLTHMFTLNGLLS
jgi:hypothetical protein